MAINPLLEPIVLYKKEKETSESVKLSEVSSNLVSPFQKVREGYIGRKYKSQFKMPSTIVKETLFKKVSLLPKKCKKKKETKVKLKKIVNKAKLKKENKRKTSSAHECINCKKVYFIPFSLKEINNTQKLGCCSYYCFKACFKEALFRKSKGESIEHTKLGPFINNDCKRYCNNINCSREYWVLQKSSKSKFCSKQCSNEANTLEYKQKLYELE